MIQFVTGTLGHGKSLYGTRRIARALLSGRAVATNIALVPGWEYVLLSHAGYYRFAGKKKKAYLEAEVRTRYWHEEDFDVLVNMGLRGKGEGRGVRIFDEAHRRLNNRSWKEDSQNAVLERMALGRHEGWDDLIISQHAKNTDVAIRRIADSEVRIVDWQKVLKIPVAHAQLLPFHMFLAMTFPIEESAIPGVQRLGRKTSSELFFLGWWKDMYDTHASHRVELEDDPNRLYLPLAADPGPSDGRRSKEPGHKPGSTPTIAPGEAALPSVAEAIRASQ